MRWFLFALLLLTLIGCQEQPDQGAEKLKDLVSFYAKEQDYDSAIRVLQHMSTLDNIEVAAIEGEIQNYEELKAILLRTRRTALEKGNFTGIARALENYRTRFQAFPLTAQGLEKLPAALQPDWVDPWGNRIYYRPSYSDNSVPKHLPDGYVLASFGEDGLPGGVDFNKDFFYVDDRMVDRIPEDRIASVVE